MKQVYLTLLFLFFTAKLLAQEEPPGMAIKIIPEAGIKIGSQEPALGAQFNFVGGALFNDKFFAGIGAGYATNMGMGGATYPVYVDGRFYFSTKKNLFFKEKDDANDFQIETQLGFDINNNKPYKTGWIAAVGFAYKFDFLKTNSKFPSFYAGLNLAYNHTPFNDEYRGFALKDGYLNHTILTIKVAFDIKPFKI